VRKIWTLVRRYWQEDFNRSLYLAIAVFLTASIVVNYYLRLENTYIDKYVGRPERILFYLVLYSVAYYGACWITFRFTGKLHFFRSKRFLLWSFAGLLILAFNIGFPYNTQMTRWISDNPRLFTWGYRVVSNLSNFLANALPLFLFAYLVGERKELFGVNRINVDLQPYFQLLLLIVPIITIASFEPGFKNYYPSYKANPVAAEMGWPEFVPALIYETAYGIDFFNVEFMFRGFMVVGMSRIIGKEAILPMVCTYCFLHFGKPIGECISSAIGGYILGVVAFYTRNIWGGVIVHMGLAWMMEFAAYLQKTFNN
jgi:hypothetical protein